MLFPETSQKLRRPFPSHRELRVPFKGPETKAQRLGPTFQVISFPIPRFPPVLPLKSGRPRLQPMPTTPAS